MKVFDIARKDLLRYFRSAFLLVMMFLAPLLITGLIYLAFGSLVGRQGSFNLPATRVVVANLDHAASQSGLAAGQILADYLGTDDLKGLLEVKPAADEKMARAAVDRREADVALILPPDFSEAVQVSGKQAAVVLYHDPTNTTGPRVVKTIVGQFLDGFSGAKIASEVATQQMSARGLAANPAISQGVAQRYAGWVQASMHDAGAGGVSLRAPAGGPPAPAAATVFLGPVMAGMLILFVFFTGAAAAESLIYEDEEGTLARLFTTPTPRVTILGGKSAGTVVTLVVQAAVLMVASALLFHIQWGQPLTIALVVAGTVVAAAGFGVFLMSFVKTSRQAGPVMGAVVTLTGLLGGLIPTGDPSQPARFATLSLLMPQGWAMQAWRLALAGASVAQVILPVLVLLVMGAALFGAGTLVFRRRFA